MGFKENDKVRVVEGGHAMCGETGTVKLVYCDGTAFSVQFDTGRESGFFLSELELVDAKREALIELAETLDKARLQANAIDSPTIQSQRGVYGQVAQALNDTLEVIFDGGQGDDDANSLAAYAYSALLDGCTVREALAVAVK